MIGLIVKDLIQMKRMLKTFVAIMLLYVVLGAVQGSSAIVGTLGVMICVMAGLSSLSMDEHGKWNQYALTLPYSRTQLVVAKYMMLSLLAGIMAVFTMVADIIIGRGISSSTAENGLVVIIGSLFTVALELPFMYKFGIERGRYIMLAVFLTPFVLAMIADKADITFSVPFIMGVIQFIEHNPWILVLLLGAWVVGSMMLSIQICKRKEY
ncbi:MAG: ABC-2 transporter permease [Lachnospiraceae bacterium]|nr:ABC-2 transporter permease [Lachnospiraceae bacterium]